MKIDNPEAGEFEKDRELHYRTITHVNSETTMSGNWITHSSRTLLHSLYTAAVLPTRGKYRQRDLHSLYTAAVLPTRGQYRQRDLNILNNLHHHTESFPQLVDSLTWYLQQPRSDTTTCMNPLRSSESPTWTSLSSNLNISKALYFHYYRLILWSLL